LIKKIRKPMAPPARIEQDLKGYHRSRRRENDRREIEEANRSDESSKK